MRVTKLAERAANSGQHASPQTSTPSILPPSASCILLRPPRPLACAYSLWAPSSLAMSSVHAASSSTQTVSPPALPAEQPPSQPGPSGPQEPSREPDAPSGPAENESRVESVQTTQDVSATSPADGAGPGSSGEPVAGPSGAEHVEVVDAEQSSVTSDDSQQWAEDDSHELKRVKVYELIGSRWVDQGTAFCFGDFQDNEALLIARAEEDFNRIILTTTIRANDVYQRQQGA